MARKFGRILTTIWKDPDWNRLTAVQQLVYLELVSSPELSWCGVAPYLPKRIALSSADMTERKAAQIIDQLAQSRYLIIDRDTDEICVRTLIKHDELLRQPNVTKAMCRALDDVRSQCISSAVLDELAAQLNDDADAKGWVTIRNDFPKVMAEVSERASGNPSPNPLRRVG